MKWSPTFGIGDSKESKILKRLKIKRLKKKKITYRKRYKIPYEIESMRGK